jgi:VWFA-related protein
LLRFLLPLSFALILIGQANAQDTVFRGKVTMEDGSPPGKLVSIQRACTGLERTLPEGLASAKTGEYFIRLNLDALGGGYSGLDNTPLPCQLEAYASGFTSSRLDLSDPKIFRNPRLPPITLTPAAKKSALTIDLSGNVPHAASRSWNLAIKQMSEKNTEGAEASLRSVVEAAPKFAPGWLALGNARLSLHWPEGARPALERAIELDPKPLKQYLMLAHAEIELKDWEAASTATSKLIAADSKHDFPEASLLRAIALYGSGNMDGALEQANEAMQLDKHHELPRAEYILGLIQEGRKDYAAAAEHLKAYVAQNPRAADVPTVNDRIANLGKAPVADLSSEASVLDRRLGTAGESPVPGGIKAFSAIAQLSGTPSYQDFFLDYCRAITEGEADKANPTQEAGDAVRAFIAAVAALETLGEQRPDSTVIRMSFENDTQIRKSQSVLAELGWKLVPEGKSFSLQPGGGPNDGFRQWTLLALGVDELAMRQAIADKRAFEFEIPKESARLLGGAAWGVVLKGVPDLPGGPIEIFIKDRRFAMVYRGLGALDSDSAAAVVSAIGLSNLIVKYSTLIADYGEVLAVGDKGVAVPGGSGAQAAWTKLVGAKPQDAGPFLRALFEKDQGRLLAFYFDLARADAAHQRYFTLTADRAEAYYRWYRDSAGAGELPKTANRWQARILQSLRMDASGKLILPGGRAAWSGGAESDDDLLLKHVPMEALAATVALEEKRGAALESQSVQLLAQHYGQWRSLFSYFEKLPGLGAEEFQALAGFEEYTANVPADRQELMLGEWHSVVELIVLGTQAGSLSATQAATAFRQVCASMRSEDPSAQALAVVREIAGDGDFDDAIAGRLLRLSGSRRESFEHVKALQKVPRVAALGTLGNSPDAGKTLAALSGVVYAALLDPAYLLVAEDPGLLSRHRFVPPSTAGLFAGSSLAVSNVAPGTNFAGGFGTFQEAAHALQNRTVGPVQTERGGVDSSEPEVRTADAVNAPVQGDSSVPPGNTPIFRAEGRIVEVYATVTDGRGRYIDDLTARQFAILEQGREKPVFAFENHMSSVSVALVFDTTGSMANTLAPLKNAALKLVDELRPTDSVAVYGFNDVVNELQPFTSDKDAAKRAILKTHAAGYTALYDALIRVNRDLSARTGKKVIIVFTDGNDNTSMLTADIAIERAKGRGIPIYTIAEGEALYHAELIGQLKNMAQSTGGTPFIIRQLSDIGPVFEKVSEDLMHGYLVAFQPDPAENYEWRKIEVVLPRSSGFHVRAREGFFAE